MLLTTRNNLARFLNEALPEASAAWVPPVDIFEQADGIRTADSGGSRQELT